MAGTADFPVEPLSAIAAALLRETTPEEREHVVVLAERAGPAPLYALPVVLPASGHPLRPKGLAVLFARAATVAAAVVGTARLRLVTNCDATFEFLLEEFRKNVALVEHLQQYGGSFSLTRASADEVPAQLRDMPFADRNAPLEVLLAGDSAAGSMDPRQRLYVGVDYGRSDVKCAVVDAAGAERATYVTRWWLPPAAGGAGEEGREYVDPAKMTSIEQPLRCLGEGALEVLRRAVGGEGDSQEFLVCGLGVSAAGCVRDGRLCGVPPAFAGCDPVGAAPVLARLEGAVLDYVREHAAAPKVKVSEPCATLLVNDGDASAMWGASCLRGDGDIGLFLSCGTGLAGGIVKAGGQCCCGGVLEVGKLVMGLPTEPVGGAPIHDTLKLAGAAQGMAGTQRSFFNLLAARGGERIEGKAEQRAAIVSMQKREMDEEVREIFDTLGKWLACFVVELSEYLPFRLTHVEVGGKLTDAASGEVMLARAREELQSHGISSVRRAEESEFGQAYALAIAARAAREDGRG